MKFGGLSINWFDLLVIGLLAFGIFRGRKRGMSEELLDVLQWLTIIVVGAMMYEPIGRVISQNSPLSLFSGYIIAYASTAIIVKLVFAGLKRAVGEKLVHADAFGRMEYYMGMLAGGLRFFCILLFAISFLHAKFISEAERAATAKMQADNFGSISFPTIGSLQQGVFKESTSGQFIAKHLDEQLMKPAPPSMHKAETIGRRRERAVEEIMR